MKIHHFRVDFRYFLLENLGVRGGLCGIDADYSVGAVRVVDDGEVDEVGSDFTVGDFAVGEV